MKRLTALVALIAALIIAVPAFATDVTFKGQYRVRGFMDSQPSLVDLSNAQQPIPGQGNDSNAWMDMRFRLRTKFTVSDVLSCTTRFDALDDRMWGSQNTPQSAETFNFDRAFMTITTEYGTLDIGRMTGGSWGHTFMDDEGDRDRIKYEMTVDNITLIAIFEKNMEQDSLMRTSDSDAQSYYLAGVYKSEMFTGGLWYGYINGKNFSDNPRDPAGTPMATPFESKWHMLDPYFTVKYLDFTVIGEAQWRFGDAMKFDRSGPNKAPNTVKDADWDAWAWNLEARYNMGPVNFQLGYAWMQGQGANPNETDIKTIGTLGDDWDKLYILTCTDNFQLENNLGGAGNINGNMGVNGAAILYLGAGFEPIENLEVSVVYGYAKAEAPVWQNASDNYGSEYDLKVKWNIYDNLTYRFIAAYLDAGDIWKWAINPNDPAHVKIENNYSLFNELKITF